MKPEINYTKVNIGFRSKGFDWPPNKYQVLIILNTIASTILCPLSTFPVCAKPQQVIFSLSYFSTFGFILYYWVKASAADPTDPVVISNRIAIRDNLPFESSRYENMCTVCNTSVGVDSKHCGNCNRCVQHFDHHCIWLNNCVGYNNYRFFIKLIILLFIHEIIIIASSTRNLHMYKYNNKTWHVTLQIFGVSIYLLIQAALLSIFLINLIILHIYLYVKGITTYEFIKSRGRRNSKVKISQDAGSTKVNVPESASQSNSN
jgi:palmitoyltransferase